MKLFKQSKESKYCKYLQFCLNTFYLAVKTKEKERKEMFVCAIVCMCMQTKFIDWLWNHSISRISTFSRQKQWPYTLHAGRGSTYIFSYQKRIWQYAIKIETFFQTYQIFVVMVHIQTWFFSTDKTCLRSKQENMHRSIWYIVISLSFFAYFAHKMCNGNILIDNNYQTFWSIFCVQTANGLIETILPLSEGMALV